jgi:uncharacterized protein (DUF983 family)
MDEKSEWQQAAGCLAAMLTLFVTMPIWYALLFWLLLNANAPTWAWVAYYVYVPVGMVAGALMHLAKLV